MDPVVMAFVLALVLIFFITLVWAVSEARRRLDLAESVDALERQLSQLRNELVASQTESARLTSELEAAQDRQQALEEASSTEKDIPQVLTPSVPAQPGKSATQPKAPSSKLGRTRLGRLLGLS